MELRKSCGVSFKYTNPDMLFIRYVVSILYFTIFLKLCAISSVLCVRRLVNENCRIKFTNYNPCSYWQHH